MNILIGYKKCGTCNGVEKILAEKNIPYEYRYINEMNPSIDELEEWLKKSGLELKKFFNTSGKIYRDLELSKKLPSMDDEEKLKLLSSDGMLVKRPILLMEDGRVFVGPQVKQYLETI